MMTPVGDDDFVPEVATQIGDVSAGSNFSLNGYFPVLTNAHRRVLSPIIGGEFFPENTSTKPFYGSEQRTK